MAQPAQHRPCGGVPGQPACPWRKDSPLGYWDRTHFEDIARNCHGDGPNMMGRHKGQGYICAGWAAVEGFDAIGLRIAAIRGTYDPDKLNTDGLDLYASMREMIEANNAVYVAQGQAPVVFDDDRRRDGR